MAIAENPSSHDGRRQEGLLARELAEVTKNMVEDALAWARGNQVKASDVLGCSKVSLWRWVGLYGIDLNAVETASRRGLWRYKTQPTDAPWVKGVSAQTSQGDDSAVEF